MWKVSKGLVMIVIPLATACNSVCLAQDSTTQDDFFADIDIVIDEDQLVSGDKSWSVTGWLREKIGYGLADPPPPFSRTDNGINRWGNSAVFFSGSNGSC